MYAIKGLQKAINKPTEYKINPWPEAIPLYGLKLEEALTLLDQYQSKEGPHLMGNYLGELGLNRLFHRAKALLDGL